MSALRALSRNVLRHDRVEEPFRLHSDVSRLERDKMIGAAGELFVGNPKLAVKSKKQD